MYEGALKSGINHEIKLLRNEDLLIFQGCDVIYSVSRAIKNKVQTSKQTIFINTKIDEERVPTPTNLLSKLSHLNRSDSIQMKKWIREGTMPISNYYQLMKYLNKSE